MLGLSLSMAVLLCAVSASAEAAVTIESFSNETSSQQSGAHADLTTSFNLRQVGQFVYGGEPSVAIVKLPPGLIGNPQNVPRCSHEKAELSALHGGEVACPADTQVGEAFVQFTDSPVSGYNLGVFNIEPGPDEPALLGIEGFADGFPVAIPISVTASAVDHYAVTARTEVQYFPIGLFFRAARVTLWGTPALHRGGAQGEDAPFMQNPTDCAGSLANRLLVNTTEEPETFAEAVFSAPTMTGCTAVPFAPAIEARPDSGQAGAPTGLTFALTTPQSSDPNGLATSALQRAIVTLPEGMTISPAAAAQQLEACTDEQFAANSDTAAACPTESVIGEDEVESPLLPRPTTGGEGKLTGKVYLGQPLSSDPTSGQMFRVFQELRGFGLDVKIPGSVVANPQTGQLTATFADLPELPFQTFKVHFRGGPNAVLVNPQTCGQQRVTSQLYPYSDPTTPASPSSNFTTSYDGNGAPCPGVLPFSPLAAITTANPQAGSLAPLTVSIGRADETQPLGQIDVKLPQGLLGYVSRVSLCEPDEALSGTCPSDSRIGTVHVSAGAGADPLIVQGSVYLAHGSNGYPFMLSVVVPAVAGPYDLGDVTVPVWLQVNSDGSLTAVSGKLPSILDGIPLDLRTITMTIDRPEFTFNPTNCGPLSLAGTADSLSGGIASLSAPFSVSGCSRLPFKPSFTVSTQGTTSKQNGAALTVRVSQNTGVADIHSVHVQLPKSLPSRLSTLNKACTEQQFAASAAACPRGSFVGTAVVNTPLLPVPVRGPAILVSHAGAAFPDLDIILQGDGITIDLVGNTNIKHGVTSSTFANVPDVPISGFELTLPEGPNSIFAANGDLCEQRLLMPTTIIGQNGATVTQDSHVAVTGCPGAKPSVKILAAKATRRDLILTVKTTTKGTVKISGAGVYTTIKKGLAAGTNRVSVSLTRVGQSMAQRHEKLALRTSLAAGHTAVVKTTHVTV